MFFLRLSFIHHEPSYLRISPKTIERTLTNELLYILGAKP